jgi:hypothetical protein
MCLHVFAELGSLWNTYTNDTKSGWVDYFFPILSLCIALGTLISGWLSDYTTKIVCGACIHHLLLAIVDLTHQLANCVS